MFGTTLYNLKRNTNFDIKAFKKKSAKRIFLNRNYFRSLLKSIQQYCTNKKQ